MKNMIILIYLIIFTFSSLPVNANSVELASGIYESKLEANNVSYEIILCENSKYYINLCDFYNDMIRCQVLSFGQYTVVDNVVSLKDGANDYVITLEKKGEILTTQKSFVTIKNKQFFLRSNIADQKISIYENYIKHKTDNKLRDNKIIPLEFGVYSNGRVNLILSHDNSYKAVLFRKSFKELYTENRGYLPIYLFFEISRGTWYREKNKLILHDSDLEYDFKASIGVDFIYNLILPGNFEDTIFKLKKEPWHKNNIE